MNRGLRTGIAAVLLVLVTVLHCMPYAAEAKEKTEKEEKTVVRLMNPGRNKDEKGAFVSEMRAAAGNNFSVRTESLPDYGKKASQEKLSEFDLLCLDNDTGDRLAAAGSVVGLEEVWKKYPNFASNMNRNVFHRAKDGKCYAIPLTGYWIALFYNRSVLADAGISRIPDRMDWDTFDGYCERINSAGFIPVAAAMADKPDYWWDYFLLNYQGTGGHTLNNFGKAEKTREELGFVMDDLRALYDLYYFSDDTFTIGWKDAYHSFIRGEAGFFLDGSWRLKNMKEDLDSRAMDGIGVVYVPALGERKAEDLIGQFNTGFYISRDAWEDREKQDALIRCLERVLQPEVLAQFSDNSVTAFRADSASVSELSAPEKDAARLLGNASSMTKAVYTTISENCRRYFFGSFPDLLTGNISTEYVAANSYAKYLAEVRARHPAKAAEIDKARNALGYCPSVDSSGEQLIQMDSLYSYVDMESDIARLYARYPGLIDYGEIGTTFQGRYMYELFVGNPTAPRQIMVQASIHAREYMCTQLVMKILEYYCRLWEDDAVWDGIPVRTLFNNICIRIVPMANPDGVSIAQFGVNGAVRADTKAWASGFEDLTQMKSNSNGVDLNRNFPTGWEDAELHEKGVSTINSLEYWKGPNPASEYETQALMNLVAAFPFKLFLNYHSMGNVVYYSSRVTSAYCHARNQVFADIIHRRTGYKLIDSSREDGPNGSFGDYVIDVHQEPSCTIEIGTDNPVPQGELFLIYLQNRDVWGDALCEVYRN